MNLKGNEASKIMWTTCFKISNLSAISATGFLLFSAWYAIPKLIQMQIIKRIVISPEISPYRYSFWAHIPVPLFRKIYIFNVSNPSEILEGMPPKFREIGPFYFHINRTKVDVTFDNEKDTVSFNEHNIFHFDEELSKPWKLDQVVTLINFPYVSAAIKIQKDLIWPLSHFAHMVLLFYKEPIFIQRTTKELLFDGYKVKFLENLEKDAQITKQLPNNMFGYFVGENDTNKGPFTVNTGVNSSNPVGITLEYKNNKNLDIWQGGRNSICNHINGTDGSIFKPLIQKNQVISIFITDICRVMHFKQTEQVTFRNLNLYRFTNLEENWDQNKCFCKTGYMDRGKCYGTGVLDLAPCRYDAPVTVTSAHFLDLDRKYLEKIGSGIKPVRGKHQTVLDIEPLTGTPIRVAVRLQINLALERVSSIPGLDKVDNMMFPLLWMEEGALMNEKFSSLIKMVVDLCTVAEYCSKVISIKLSFALIVFQLRKNKHVTFGGNQANTIFKQSIKQKNDESIALTSEE